MEVESRPGIQEVTDVLRELLAPTQPQTHLGQSDQSITFFNFPAASKTSGQCCAFHNIEFIPNSSDIRSQPANWE